MTTYFPPKVNTQYIFYAALVSQANTKTMQSNPTIAAGDFKVSIDGGALANLGTLPTVTPASSVMVKFTLSTSEMNGANITVVCIDAAGAEWCDAVFNIQTTARQIDDLAYPATSGRSMVVDASGLVDANAVKLGPTGSGTAQTARDIGLSVLLASGQKVDVDTIKTNPVVNAGTVTFPTGATLASTTNITAGTIATATNVTTVNGLASNVITAASINASALNGKGDWNIGKTGYSLSAAGVQAIWDALTSALTTVGSIGKMLVTNLTGDIYARIGAPAGASIAADIAAVKTDTAAVKVQTDKLTFTVANQIDANVIDWKSATAPAMTGDAYARLGAPSGASVSADIAAIKTDTAAVKAKTDQLAFTVANQVDANAESMNATTINGTGTSGDLWRGS